MYNAYVSGDVYLAFGKEAGLIPIDGTKKTHPKERQSAKSTVLGLSFSMSKIGLAIKLSQDTGKEVTEDEAQELVDMFADAFSDNAFWKKENLEMYEDNGYLKVPDGWTLFGDNDNPRSVGNLPIQGFGSCILRKAIQLCQDKGLKVIVPLHDALYIEMETNDWDAVDIFAEQMTEAFKFYFKGEGNKWASKVGLDIEAWGNDLNKEVITTPKGNSVQTDTLHIDERSVEEYNIFSKFFGTPDIDFV